MRDFAFFCVHFNFTKSEYEALTPAERSFILKAYEEKTVADSTLMRDAVFNALINANRKRGKPFRQLWRKAAKKATREEMIEKRKIITKIEEKEKGWIARIYAANGLKTPIKKESRKRG